MKKLFILLVAGAFVYGLGFLQDQGVSMPGPSSWGEVSGTAVEAAYNNKKSDVQVQGQFRGRVRL